MRLERVIASDWVGLHGNTWSVWYVFRMHVSYACLAMPCSQVFGCGGIPRPQTESAAEYGNEGDATVPRALSRCTA